MCPISIKNEMILNYIEALAPGAKVSVRELSAQLNVSEGTAYKAVKDAEQRGLVTVKPKAGTIRVNTEPEDFQKFISARDVARLLGLVVVAGKAALSREVKRLVICDGSEQSILRQLEGQDPGTCICICGDRPEVQTSVLEQGANLVLTGGTKASWYQIDLAEKNGLYILSSPQSSYSLIRLFDTEFSAQMNLSGSGPVGDWMQTPDYLYYNDIVADWQRMYFENSMPKQYPVVDDELEIIGGLDLWSAAATVPSGKLRSLVGEAIAFPQVSIHDDIKHVARKFVVNGDELAAVLDGKRMVGIITSNDLLRYYMYSEPDTLNTGTDSFLVKDQNVSGGETAVYSIRVPDSELYSIPHFEINLLLSAAGSLLRQIGCTNYTLDNGTFFSTKAIHSVKGLMVACRVQPSGRDGYVIETEINDDSVSYAIAVFVATGASKEEKNV